MVGQFNATLLQDSADGGNGVVNWTFTVDPTLVHTLKPGTVLSEVFNVIVTDNYGASAIKAGCHHDRRPK